VADAAMMTKTTTMTLTTMVIMKMITSKGNNDDTCIYNLSNTTIDNVAGIQAKGACAEGTS
jgi:hypothetical protein